MKFTLNGIEVETDDSCRVVGMSDWLELENLWRAGLLRREHAGRIGSYVWFVI